MLNLSKQGQRFIEEMRVYLTTKGIGERELEEFLAEAESHLSEGQAEGKTVESIFGGSPKAYADQLAKELGTSRKEWLGLIFQLMLGLAGYFMLNDALSGEAAYSLIALIGYPVVYMVSILIIRQFLQMASFATARKQIFAAGVYGVLNLAMLLALTFLDHTYGTPIWQAGTIGLWGIGSVAILIFIGLAAATRQWIWIVLPVVYSVPGIVLRLTIQPAAGLEESVVGLVEALLMLVMVIIAAFVLICRKKKELR